MSVVNFLRCSWCDGVGWVIVTVRNVAVVEI